MQYNIKVIIYMIQSFKNMLDTMGYKSSTVKLFKMNVDNMVSTRQVRAHDVDLVYRMLSIEKTDVIKQEHTINRLNHINTLINAISTLEQRNANVGEVYQSLKKMAQNKVVSEKSLALVCELYGLDTKNIYSSTEKDKISKLIDQYRDRKYVIGAEWLGRMIVVELGDLLNDCGREVIGYLAVTKKPIVGNKLSVCRDSVGDMQASEYFGHINYEKLFIEISKKKTNLNENDNDRRNFENYLQAVEGRSYKVRVRNPDAVCSCDPYYFYYTAHRFTKAEIEYMEQDSTYDVVYASNDDSACASSRINYVLNQECTKLLRKVSLDYLRSIAV